MEKHILTHPFLRTISYALLCAALMPGLLSGVEIYPNAGTTSAAFLKLGAGSRAIAMGSAYAGLADDASAMYWNPAGLAQLTRQEVQVYHNESFESIRNDFLAYVHPVRTGVTAAGFSALYTPKDIERRSGLDEADPYEPLSPVEGYFQAYDIAAHAAYGRWLRPNLAGGASLKLIQQTIDTESAYGIGADIGVLYRCPRLPLSSGFVIQNIGTPIKFINKSYPLPLNFKLGAAWRWKKGIVTTLDLNKPIDNFLFMAAGAEYNPMEFLSLRLGYRYRWYGLELGDLSGLSAGAGFHFKLRDTSLSFDYAFVPFGILGNSHRISVGLQFGAATPPPSAAQPSLPVPQKDDYGIRTVSPALPRTSAPSSATIASVDYRGYTFRTASISNKRMMSTNRMVIFGIHAACETGGLRAIEGTVRSPFPRNLKLEFGEKPGAGDVCTYYVCRTTGAERMKDIVCTLMLPRQSGDIIIRTSDGTTIMPRKTEQTADLTTYQFNLRSLVPFQVQKR